MCVTMVISNDKHHLISVRVNIISGILSEGERVASIERKVGKSAQLPV